MFAIVELTVQAKAFLTGLMWLFGCGFVFGLLFQPQTKNAMNIVMAITLIPSIIFFFISAFYFVFL